MSSWTQSILCIVSENQILANLTKELSRLEYDIFSASSRSSGWDTFVSNDIDNVVVDLKLDNELCVDLIEEFQFVKPDIGVFVLTDLQDFKLAVQLIDLGILGLIEKPIQFPIFLERLDKKLKNKFLLNSKRIQNPELTQCCLCTKVNYSDLKNLDENAWVSLEHFLKEFFLLQLNREFCLSCSKLTLDQVENHLLTQFRKLKKGEINLKTL